MKRSSKTFVDAIRRYLTEKQELQLDVHVYAAALQLQRYANDEIPEGSFYRDLLYRAGLLRDNRLTEAGRRVYKGMVSEGVYET
jgi:hypothetical protein